MSYILYDSTALLQNSTQSHLINKKTPHIFRTNEVWLYATLSDISYEWAWLEVRMVKQNELYFVRLSCVTTSLNHTLLIQKYHSYFVPMRCGCMPRWVIFRMSGRGWRSEWVIFCTTQLRHYKISVNHTLLIQNITQFQPYRVFRMNEVRLYVASSRSVVWRTERSTWVRHMHAHELNTMSVQMLPVRSQRVWHIMCEHGVHALVRHKGIALCGIQRHLQRAIHALTGFARSRAIVITFTNMIHVSQVTDRSLRVKYFMQKSQISWISWNVCLQKDLSSCASCSQFHEFQ